MSGTDGLRREVAYRVFATEYNDATHSYQESDEERAPKYVVTPTGARVNRVFVVGVLTEVERVGDDIVRARVVDPTGAFVVYAGQYQPEALAFFEDVDPPVFVAVTGKANTFEPEGSDRTFTSIRPESVTEVDAQTRDRWVVGTAERTIERIAWFGAALDHEASGQALQDVLTATDVNPALAAGISKAIEVYDTGRPYLAALRSIAVETLHWVTGDLEEVSSLTVEPGETGEFDGSLSAPTVDPALPEAIEEEPSTATDRTVEEPAPEPGTVGEQVGTDAGAGAPSEAEPASGPGETVEREAGSGGTGAGTESSEPPAEEELYELDEEERHAVEEEYGVEFSSGQDIPDAGEAEIDTPAVEEPPDDEDGSGTDADEDAEGLEDVVVDTMRTLADGGAADREELIDRVMTDRDTTRAAVEEAIQDALMSGRCYESDDDELTPI